MLLVQSRAVKNSSVGTRDELVRQVSFVVEREKRPAISASIWSTRLNASTAIGDLRVNGHFCIWGRHVKRV